MASLSETLGDIWDETKGIYREYIDYENFQAEIDLEQSVQDQERQNAIMTAPAPMPGPSLSGQIMQYLPWIIGGGLVIWFAPKLLKKL